MEQIHTYLHPWYPAIGGLILCFIIRCVYLKIALKILHSINAKINIPVFEDALKAFEQPISLILFIIGIYAFFSQAPISSHSHIAFVEKLLRSAIIISFFWGVYNVTYTTHSLMIKLLDRLGIHAEPTVSGIISTMVHIFIVIVGFVAIAKEWNYDITGFIASLSIASVAVAFAAKDALANVFGSFVIIIDKPFVVGDWISANGIEGIVEKVSFRSTCVRTFPQELVYIPNSLLSNTPIINYNKRQKRRIDFFLNLTYSTKRVQMEKLTAKIKDFLLSKDYIISETVEVNFSNFNDSSLDVRILCYANNPNPTSFRKLNNDINLGLLDILEEEGLSCAFPSTSVYFENKLSTTNATDK